jgi:hypothetical protein
LDIGKLQEGSAKILMPLGETKSKLIIEAKPSKLTQ